MFRSTYPACVTVAWIASFLLTITASAASWCDHAIDLEPDMDWRGDAHLEDPIFRWRVPSSGVATVELLGEGSPWIDLGTETCDRRPADATLIEQSSSHLVLAVRSAGEVFLRVGAAASGFRIVTSFTQATVAEKVIGRQEAGGSIVQTDFLATSLPESKTEAEIADPDPDGQHQRPGRMAASIVAVSSSPTPKTEAEIADPDPDGALASSRGSINAERVHVLLLDATCRQAELDDHGDMRACATPLIPGRSVMGMLANNWGDDSDLFSFHVDAVSRVEIALAADTPDVRYALMGPGGQQLAVGARPMGHGSGAFVRATLVPGRYFFRVGGGSGAYALDLVTYD